jgi:hypothetical protein
MKKLLTLLFTAALAISLAAPVFAQDSSAQSTDQSSSTTKPAKTKKAKTKKAKKAKSDQKMDSSSTPPSQ